MKALLDRCQQTDPRAGLPDGSFTTPACQALHDALVATSRSSLIDGLKVGVQIESTWPYRLSSTSPPSPTSASTTPGWLG